MQIEDTSSSAKEPVSTQSIKIKICKTLIRPVATYGTESCTLNIGIAEWLAAFKEEF
jgi:hypothetical protein